MTQAPEAIEVVLRKVRPLAPPFHRHIAKSKLLNNMCQVGDRCVVYEIVDTVPAGPVCVTEKTVFQFR